MSNQDPISGMLTSIRNAQRANHTKVTMDSSKFKVQIVQVLKDEGFVADFEVNKINSFMSELTVYLKYYQGRPVIERIKRISRPGLRIYRSAKDIKPVPGFGVYILSTSKGVMTHCAAKKNSVGGEVICEVA